MKIEKIDNKVLWSELKYQLSDYSQVKLLELISDLHSLSNDNKRFIEAKVMNNDDSFKKYRSVIGKSISIRCTMVKKSTIEPENCKESY